jgi:hypothetical protein
MVGFIGVQCRQAIEMYLHSLSSNPVKGLIRHRREYQP